MKWLFLLLLAANAGVFVWQYRETRQPPAQPQASLPMPGGAPLLVLLREREPASGAVGQADAAAAPRTAGPAVAEQPAATSDVNDDRQPASARQPAALERAPEVAPQQPAPQQSPSQIAAAAVPDEGLKSGTEEPMPAPTSPAEPSAAVIDTALAEAPPPEPAPASPQAELAAPPQAEETR